MALSVAQLQSRLDAYLAAELKILDSQEYRIGGRGNRRAELDKIQAQIDKLNRQISAASTSRTCVGKLGRARTTDR